LEDTAAGIKIFPRDGQQWNFGEQGSEFREAALIKCDEFAQWMFKWLSGPLYLYER